jgi:branched-subunit amino acid transport protein
VALSLPALVVVGLLQGLAHSIAGALDLPSGLAAISNLVIDLALLAGLVWGIVARPTRYLVLGILAGIAVLFVLAAGACVVILSGLGTSS